ncbi:MAG: DUF2157 domain-containing protein [Acidobacteria bacterium]|nr:MAG: DUF2157 domain-containing protein [Acidobacteriota bacterium]MCE7956699.1 DUF2157 domain-containing protein [Acidobacteria bacterium ACB2]
MPEGRRETLPLAREEAQRRVDRIRAFREELSELEREGVLVLSADQRASLDGHHEELLDRLGRSFDVDRTEGQKRLSLAMRIASFLGAVAIGAAGYFFCLRFWGGLGPVPQVSVLVAAPLVALAGTAVAARRERTLYLTLLAALLATAAFVIDLSVLSGLLNLPLPPSALLAWSAFCFALAYGYGLRVLLVGGIAFLVGFVATFSGQAELCLWHAFGRRPESFLPLGALLYAFPIAVPHRRHASFPAAYRALGLVCLFVPILLLSTSGWASFSRAGAHRVETAYQVAGFLLAGLAVWAGVRRGEGETTNLGSGFFVLLLYVKLFQWWWDWMPKWAFFLVLGLVAVGLLLLFRRLHATRRRAGS